LLAHCEDVHQKRICELRGRKPRCWPIPVGLLLLLFSGAIIAAQFFEILSDILYDLIDIDLTQNFAPIFGAFCVLAAGGVVLLAYAIANRWRHERTLRGAIGEDFSGKQYAPCSACGLKYLRSKDECPFCGSGRPQPLTKPEVLSQPDASEPTIQVMVGHHLHSEDAGIGQLSMSRPKRGLLFTAGLGSGLLAALLLALFYFSTGKHEIPSPSAPMQHPGVPEKGQVVHEPLMPTATPVASAPATPTAREVAKRVLPSVVMLVLEDSDGDPVIQGSGFVVGEGIVATNSHVVSEAIAGHANLVGQETPHRIRGAVAKDTNWDLVLLSVPGVKAQPLPLGDENQLAVGDKVYVAGNPKGLEGTFSEGIVSGVRRVRSHAVLQFTAPISHGSSGGPVLTSSGLVVGVAAAMLEGGQNLNFAVPVSRVKSLLSAMREPVALSALEVWEPNLTADEARYVAWLEAALESCEETLLNLIVAMDDIDSYSPAGFLAFLDKRSPAGLCYAMYFGSPNIPTFNECPLRVKQAYSFTYEAVNSVFSVFSGIRQALVSLQNLQALPRLLEQLCVKYEKNRDAAEEEFYKLRAGQQ
jgi:S1-C subfamily serine protease